MPTPEISIITPTRNRADFLRQLAFLVQAQTLWPQAEWLIYDDSEAPYPFLEELAHPNIHYTHSAEKISIGQKRQLLAEQARGRWIAHFDDDDWYASTYLYSMLHQLQRHNSHFIKLSHWITCALPRQRWGYFNPNHYLSHSEKDFYSQDGSTPPPISLLWGYGFSYVYAAELVRRYPFPQVSFGEDHLWILEKLLPDPAVRLSHIPDIWGLVVHRLHETSSSVIPKRLSHNAALQQDWLLAS